MGKWNLLLLLLSLQSASVICLCVFASPMRPYNAIRCHTVDDGDGDVADGAAPPPPSLPPPTPPESRANTHSLFLSLSHAHFGSLPFGVYVRDQMYIDGMKSEKENGQKRTVLYGGTSCKINRALRVYVCE